MKSESSLSEAPGRLARFYAAGGQESSSCLNDLLQTEVRPIVAASVKRRLSSFLRSSQESQQDLEDIVQDCLLRVAQQLLAGTKGEAEIKSLGGYSARVAEHACDEFFRSKYRKRYNATKRVLVNLRENPAFYEWKDGAKPRRGALSAWLPPPPIPPESRPAAIRFDLSATTTAILLAYHKGGPNAGLGSALCMHASLLWAEGALEVDDLVLVLQSARNEFDEPERVLDSETTAAPITEPTWTETEFLRAVWAEISQLRPSPAKALLLNLRIKGEYGIEWFTDAGIVGTDELAGLLGFDPDTFQNETLNELPWPDKRVAAFLNCTEEQVTALRSAARRTLAARLIASGRFPEEVFRFRL